MFAVRGFDELSSSFAVQAKITHQSSNSANTVMVPLFRQFDLNPGRSIAPFVLTMNVFNKQFELFIFGFPR